MKTGTSDPLGRRRILKLLGTLPLAGGFVLSEAQAQDAQARVQRAAAKGFVPKFFTPHEWATVRVLVDIVIPRDERSGSATDAQVPEFMDFILDDPLADPFSRERNKTQMRGGLSWLDRECARRFSGRRFLEASESERKLVLDSIAYPKDPDAETERSAVHDPVTFPNKTPQVAPPTGTAAGAPPAADGADTPPVDRLTHGIAFFNAFRDLTASGFWSSAIGVKDIEYTGNTFVAEWKGCPPAVLAKLGLSGERKS